MKQKHIGLFFLILFTLFSFLSLSNASLSTSDVCIFELTQNGSQVFLTLDFDLSATPARGETKSLVVLIVFVLPSNSANNNIGSMFFIHTNTGVNYVFWMLGDPFSTVGLWQKGYENEHFQVDCHQLSLLFIENAAMNNPELQIIAQAKIWDIGPFDPTNVDFHLLLNEFRADFELSQTIGMVSSSTATTTTTKAKGFPGFLIPLNMGILILLGVKKRRDKLRHYIEN